MAESISQHLGHFAVGLTYADIPSEVIDKAKACLLHALAVGMVGSTTPGGQKAIKLVKNEESLRTGASVLVDGSRVTRLGAAFANSQLLRIPQQWDSYRVLVHPGLSVIPAALATGELESSSGKELLTAIVAAYETEVRLAGDFIPSVQARGFRSSGVFDSFGAAVATAKLFDFSEDQMASVIALAATFASGTLEGARVRTSEMEFQEPANTLNGILAALLVRDGAHGAEEALEGPAGFYYAFTGSNKGELTFSFSGQNRTDLGNITRGLGQHYEMLELDYKIYPTAGSNNPTIILASSLKKSKSIQPEKIERIQLEMYWLEVLYPSPLFITPVPPEPTIGGREYFVAYTLVEGDYPLYGTPVEVFAALEKKSPEKAAQVRALMKKTIIAPSKERHYFAPMLNLTMEDGQSYQDELTGNELQWGLKEEIIKIRGLAPFLPVPEKRFSRLMETIANLEQLSSVGELMKLTQP